MIFSYNWLQSFFEKRLPKPEKLAELLTMHSFEVSELKKVGKDFTLDIDVLPNRGPDCFSHIGVARECSVLLNSKLKMGPAKAGGWSGREALSRSETPRPWKGWSPNFKFKENKQHKAKDFVRVEVKNKMACPRYTARVVSGVKVASSPKWLRQRLKVCGIKPINNIVDIANFVMLETGQPLHAFDGEKLEGKKIIVRFAKKRERIVTLDEERYDLNPDILVIADARKPIAIAGIKGGIMPEIDKKTKIVVLESANFNPRVIRKGSKKLSLKTDASWRFEHGIDPNLTEMAINRAAFLIQKIAGGIVSQGLIDKYPRKILPKIIKLNLNYLKSLLGIEIPKNKILKILKNLEFKVLDSKHQVLKVKIPTFRLDISISEDLIEEIARVYGYQEVPATFPIGVLVPPKRNIEIFWESLTKNILKEFGFSEVYNYSFVSERDREAFGYKIRDLIEIENPVSIEQRYLRPSLIPNFLKNLQKNFKYQKKIRIFELGKIFQRSKVEKKMLTALLAKKEVSSGADEFYYLKGILDLLLNKLGISNIWYDSYRPTPEESKLAIWQPKKCAEIKVDGEEIGFLGEISPKILEDFKINTRVVVFDLDFEKLQTISSEEQEYRPISPYPAAVRDISVLVPQGILVEEVLNKIESTGGPLIRDIDLFDIYEGEEIPSGKKNLAFHIIYQASDRTLDSKEIDEIQKRIIGALEKESGWEVRK
ncbi:phenylalanine--tRNA ligase subunit beta [Patescibacteria group bacterium]|nr:phenylalanine--tRNA ligase subunit beta [Patescibacteria group bacterium]